MHISAQLAQIAYTDALQHLVTGFVLLGIVGLALLVAGFAWRKYRSHPYTEEWAFVSVIALLVATAGIFLTLFFLANIWNWVGIQDPALLAAKQQIAEAHRPRPLL
ncbi:hypothetical protein [Acidithiobacillus concretivorus]|uniref:DUF202 domain-containing protein n=1 Tax=Acidithiobacillus concretivorus TaxID=3063952 RepID=A0ABS5ZT87_9PROT|nr:hypothetical protein [Acidithiobacillus concretivorus]MBU2739876.1 hypothetical protein [Acidithiobacillus concretivorus]